MQDEAMIYERAGNLVMEYPKTHTVRFDTPVDEITSLLNDFKEKFGPDVLKKLSDDELLSYLFLTADGTNDSLCYHLEFNQKLSALLEVFQAAHHSSSVFFNVRKMGHGLLALQRHLKFFQSQMRCNLVKQSATTL